MYKIFTLMMLLCGMQIISMAQTNSLSATLLDATDKKPVKGATVSLLLRKDSTIVQNTVSDAMGAFVFNNLPLDTFIVQVTALNYQEYLSFIRLKEGANELGNFELTRQGKDLANVTVVAKTPPVSQKGDTVQYNASQYKVNPDANVEDLVKKMPGITVDKSGTVTAQGEQVKKVTVDGRDFFW